ncbi:hypothetical protein HK101_000300, partial [Irineochytrium annulatum]
PDEPVPPYTPPYDPTVTSFIHCMSSALQTTTRREVQGQLAAVYAGDGPDAEAAWPLHVHDQFDEFMRRDGTPVEEFEATVLGLVLKRSAMEAAAKVKEDARELATLHAIITKTLDAGISSASNELEVEHTGAGMRAMPQIFALPSSSPPFFNQAPLSAEYIPEQDRDTSDAISFQSLSVEGSDHHSHPLARSRTVRSNASSGITELLSPAVRQLTDCVEPRVNAWRMRQLERDRLARGLKSAREDKLEGDNDPLKLNARLVVILTEELEARRNMERDALTAGTFVTDELERYENQKRGKHATGMDVVTLEQMRDLINIWFAESEKDAMRISEIELELATLFTGRRKSAGGEARRRTDRWSKHERYPGDSRRIWWQRTPACRCRWRSRGFSA